MCLSTTLLQRVLLCQFIDTSASGASTTSSTTSTSTTRPQLIDPPSSAPTVHHVEKYFRQIFTKYLLSLGCLHALPGSAVRLPLDNSFCTLLQEHYRQDMWRQIHDDSVILQQQLLHEEHIFELLRSALQPIYKQHGLPPLKDLSVLAALTKQRNRKRRGCGGVVMESDTIPSSSSSSPPPAL